jgi:hypothetical protein
MEMLDTLLPSLRYYHIKVKKELELERAKEEKVQRVAEEEKEDNPVSEDETLFK